MKIKWFGHSCFLLTSANGTKVLTDPFDKSVGYEVPAVDADVVTVSHGHFDHNYIDAVTGSFEVFSEAGRYSSKGIDIQGFPVFHDESKGAKRGKNIIFKLSIDGINLCHCGDLGHILSPEQVEEIGSVDVLLLPVGGVYTIDAKGAFQIMKLLKPKVTIPMHFKTEALTFSLEGVNKFLADAGGGEMAGKQEIEILPDSVSNLSNIIVLNYR